MSKIYSIYFSYFGINVNSFPFFIICFHHYSSNFFYLI
jgi:hypothetical protein